MFITSCIYDENVLSLKLNDFVCVLFSLGEKLIQVVDSNILCHISTSLKQTTDKLFFKDAINSATIMS